MLAVTPDIKSTVTDNFTLNILLHNFLITNIRLINIPANLCRTTKHYQTTFYSFELRLKLSKSSVNTRSTHPIASY